MTFKDTLAGLPNIDHLDRINICDESGKVIHSIPAVPGKLGSLRVYYALAQQFHDQLTPEAAEHGLTLFAEHTADAQQHPGKHPNIDFLLQVCDHQLHLRLIPLEDDI
ncbi:DUF2322 family protein [Snodgrassella sp. CFCC 13594]|uniref:DUF2322 family protein n=1 Tax=Snodgrassella sp. CFCC 13594 TaxID=1775559 RepID=UPI00082AB95C|nr:DUF2322 family protein [Snodgrassella sp. CFCC 13594]